VSRLEVSKIVSDLVWWWKMNTSKEPIAINSGWCGDFARDLSQELPGSSVRWDYKHAHAYVSFNGRYYDSETPSGVRRVKNLPCVQRTIKERRL
jgi:hypothetical protein